MSARATIVHEELEIPAGHVTLKGSLAIPDGAQAVILFAHGSGSSRFSPRNRLVAEGLQQASLGTLLFDLLTPEEEEIDEQTRHLRFDIGLLADRLVETIDWTLAERETRRLKIGLFGSSTGAAGALVAASERPKAVGAVVSRGGRPDLAGHALPKVECPVLFIVGGEDWPVIDMNRDASRLLRTEHRLTLVPGATHLFQEPGALEQALELAREWFVERLVSQP